MTYRDEIVEYAQACLDGVDATLKEPRISQLNHADVDSIYQRLLQQANEAGKRWAEKGQEEEANKNNNHS